MKKIFHTLFILFLGLSACQVNTNYEVVNLLNNKIFVLGHGGMGVGNVQYPINSYEGIANALSMGADGSEIDMQMTKDSVLVAFHDSFLEEATDHEGHIYDKNWAEIKDATYNKGPYTTYTIASMNRIFTSIPPANYGFTLDLKFNSPDTSAAYRDLYQRAIIRLVDEFKLKKITIESPSEDFIKALLAKRSDLNVFIYNDYDEAFRIAKDLGLKGVTLKASDVSEAQVKELHQNNIAVAVFSTTFKNHDETIRKNVDIIQTDGLKDLLKRLK